MAKLFLNISLVKLGRACGDRSLDQAGDMLVVEPGLKRSLTIARGAYEDRSETDLCEVKPLLQRMHRSGLICGAAANLDFAPAGLGVQGQQCAFVYDLDPSAAVGRVVFVDIKPDDCGNR